MKGRLLFITITLWAFIVEAQTAPVKDSTKQATPPPVQIAPQPKVIIFWFTESEAQSLFNGLGDCNAPYGIVVGLKEKMQKMYANQPAPPAPKDSVKRK